MVIWETLHLWPQYDESWFVPIEVLREIFAGIPDIIRVCIDGCEDIEKVLDIHIL